MQRQENMTPEQFEKIALDFWESKLSIAAFCEQRGYSVRTFKQWKEQFKEIFDEKRWTVESREIHEAVTKISKKMGIAFDKEGKPYFVDNAPVEFTEAPQQKQRDDMVVTFPNGVKITFTGKKSLEVAKEFLNVLRLENVIL